MEFLKKGPFWPFWQLFLHNSTLSALDLNSFQKTFNKTSHQFKTLLRSCLLLLIFILKKGKRSQNDLCNTLVFASFFWIVFRSVFAKYLLSGSKFDIVKKKQNAQSKNLKKNICQLLSVEENMAKKTEKERIATKAHHYFRAGCLRESNLFLEILKPPRCSNQGFNFCFIYGQNLTISFHKALG